MDKKRFELMKQRDAALAARNISLFQSLTTEIAKLPMKGIAPLRQSDIDKWNKR